MSSILDVIHAIWTTTCRQMERDFNDEATTDATGLWTFFNHLCEDAATRMSKAADYNGFKIRAMLNSCTCFFDVSKGYVGRSVHDDLMILQ